MPNHETYHASSRAGVAGKILVAAAVVGIAGLAIALGTGSMAAGRDVRPIPQALHDIAATGETQTAVLAGGCFWGVQAVFQHVTGVVSATSGYAGGSAETATYEMTETGQTGHAEAVEIMFDPAKVSYGTLLQIFFSAAHDPTQSGGQGPDIGTQYRSAVFPLNEEQAEVASGYVRQLDAAGVFGSRIATTIEPGQTFYRAEAYHQDYVFNHPGEPYVLVHEQPKLEALRRLFPTLYRDRPVLVSGRAG